MHFFIVVWFTMRNWCSRTRAIIFVFIPHTHILLSCLGRQHFVCVILLSDLWSHYGLQLLHICSSTPVNRVWCMKSVKFPYKNGLVTGADLKALNPWSFSHCYDNQPPNQYFIFLFFIFKGRRRCLSVFFNNLLSWLEGLLSVFKRPRTCSNVTGYLSRKTVNLRGQEWEFNF